MVFDEQDLKYVVYHREQGNTFTIGFITLEEAQSYANTVTNLIGIYKVEKVN